MSIESNYKEKAAFNRGVSAMLSCLLILSSLAMVFILYLEWIDRPDFWVQTSTGGVYECWIDGRVDEVPNPFVKEVPEGACVSEFGYNVWVLDPSGAAFGWEVTRTQSGIWREDN